MAAMPFRTLVAALILFGAAGTASARPERVAYDGEYRPGTIVVDTSARHLYFITDRRSAIRYPVAVGRPGKQWHGRASIVSKRIRPPWSPPDEIRRDNPRLPDVIPAGAPNNPMGAAALVLSRGQYAIHGTNRPNSIGSPASYGCIRMYNQDILDLYDRVREGTVVYVLP